MRAWYARKTTPEQVKCGVAGLDARLYSFPPNIFTPLTPKRDLIGGLGGGELVGGWVGGSVGAAVFGCKRGCKLCEPHKLAYFRSISHRFASFASCRLISQYFFE